MLENITPSMMVTSFKFNGKESFKLIPVSLECPFVEAFLEPTSKTLIVASKTIKEKYHMMNSLDPFGKNSIKNGAPLLERRLIPSFHEYDLSTKEDILDFINIHCVNSSDFNLEKFLG